MAGDRNAEILRTQQAQMVQLQRDITRLQEGQAELRAMVEALAERAGVEVGRG